MKWLNRTAQAFRPGKKPRNRPERATEFDPVIRLRLNGDKQYERDRGKTARPPLLGGG